MHGVSYVQWVLVYAQFKEGSAEVQFNIHIEFQEEILLKNICVMSSEEKSKKEP